MLAKEIEEAMKSLEQITKHQTENSKKYLSLISEYLNIAKDMKMEEMKLPPTKQSLIKEHESLGQFTKYFDFERSNKEIIETRKYSSYVVEFVTRMKLYYQDKKKKPLIIYEKTQMLKEADGVWRLFNSTPLYDWMNQEAINNGNEE